MSGLQTIQAVGNGLQVAFDKLSSIATSKGHKLHSVTINVEGTDLSAGVIVGNATVNNRSRRNFKLSVIDGGRSGVQVEFMGEKQKIAA
jgi:hypothetical protein